MVILTRRNRLLIHIGLHLERTVNQFMNHTHHRLDLVDDSTQHGLCGIIVLLELLHPDSYLLLALVEHLCLSDGLFKHQVGIIFDLFCAFLARPLIKLFNPILTFPQRNPQLVSDHILGLLGKG